MRERDSSSSVLFLSWRGRPCTSFPVCMSLVMRCAVGVSHPTLGQPDLIARINDKSITDIHGFARDCCLGLRVSLLVSLPVCAGTSQWRRGLLPSRSLCVV